MLRDQYEIDKFFMDIAQRASEMDAVLVQMDSLLDDEVLYQMLRQDMAQRHARSATTGRPSTPVAVVLRMLAVKHLYALSYEQTEQQVRDSLVLRHFCRVYLNAVPDDTVLLRWAQQLQPETLVAFNPRLSRLAVELRVMRGRKLRTDGTVVESNIAYPSDSKLLADGVRVISRTLKRIQSTFAQPGERAAAWFRNRTRSARTQARQIQRRARQRSQAAQAEMQSVYRRLVAVAQATVQQAKTVVNHLQSQLSAQGPGLMQQLQTVVPQVEQVIEQTMRRVFAGEAVPAREKLVSLFESHAAIIRRQKPGKETEFGHKVWLDEVEGGLLTRWEILAGNQPSTITADSLVAPHTMPVPTAVSTRPPTKPTPSSKASSASSCPSPATNQPTAGSLKPNPGSDAVVATMLASKDASVSSNASMGLAAVVITARRASPDGSVGASLPTT